MVFIGAIGTLVGSQIADLLQDSDTYISDTVDTINDTFGTNLDAQGVIDDFNDPDGAVQEFIADQQDNVVRLSVAALGGLLQLLSVALFTFYLVADGPKLRRAICSRLTPARQERVLGAWELAGTKTGGYLYSRALLALLSAVFHWIVFQSLGTAAPVALALWVGIVSQFLPVVGTYLAGVLPVLLTFIDSPLKAWSSSSPSSSTSRSRTTSSHRASPPARWSCTQRWRSGLRSAGAAVLGAVGAVLALPAAAMGQALVSDWGDRHQVIQSELTDVRHPRVWKRGQGPARPPGGASGQTSAASARGTVAMRSAVRTEPCLVRAWGGARGDGPAGATCSKASPATAQLPA